MVDDMDFSQIDEEAEKGLSPDDFKGGQWVKNPELGAELIFVVQKIVENKNTKGKNSESGAEFDIGLKQKNGKVQRYDIHTDMGIYTISNWEIYFKLLDKNPKKIGLLMTYAKEHGNTFAGAKVSIKKLVETSHNATKLDLLSKALNMTMEEAKKYQDGIKLAIKEQRCFEVKLK